MEQNGWRWCHKCQGLFFSRHNLGVCPAGGKHDISESGDYILRQSEPDFGQHEWRWCPKCQGLFFSGHNMGVCPAGGEHSREGSGDYSLEQQ
jgi:hypothetical protein